MTWSSREVCQRVWLALALPLAACIAALDATGGGPAGADGEVDPSGDESTPADECAGSDPSWLFCDSFEAADEAPFWDGSSTYPVRLADPGPLDLADNHVVRLRVPPGRGGASLYKELATQAERAYVRFYVRWEPGYDFDAPVHGPGGLHGGRTDCVGCSGSRPDDWFTSTLEHTHANPPTLQAYTYYPGMYMDCADPDGACWGDMFPCTAGPSYCTEPAHAPTVTQAGFVTGRWYCVEQMIDAGTPTSDPASADGVLDFWIDGLEIGPWTHMMLRQYDDVKVSALWLYLFHHDEHSAVGLELDDVVVSSERVGCRESRVH
jgi:hypothetical protein